MSPIEAIKSMSMSDLGDKVRSDLQMNAHAPRLNLALLTLRFPA